MMTTLDRAVLEFTTSMHNLKTDPSPENLRDAAVVGSLLCGLALEVQRKLAEQQAAPRAERAT